MSTDAVIGHEKNMVAKIYSSLLDFLFPPRCPICQAYVEEQGGWCEDCLRSAVDVRQIIMPEGSPLSKVWALGHYRGGLRDLIRKLKYRQKRSSLPYIMTFLVACRPYLSWLGKEPLLAVPVPLYIDKERQRGFNQAEMIFREWLEAEGVACTRIMERIRATRPMYELSRQERAENLVGAFALKEAAAQAVCGKSLLLLDDIMTTGSTLKACAEILKHYGAKSVEGIVLASDTF